MSRSIHVIALVVVLALGTGPSMFAQAPEPSKPAPPAQPAPPSQPTPSTAPQGPGVRLIPLSIEVVIARYEGEKKISSHPFTLAVNANDVGQSQLRMGANVPVPSGAITFKPPAGGDAPAPSANPFITYREIGTSIDCSARTGVTGADEFQVRLSVEDTSVYAGASGAPTAGEAPVFRTFRSANTLILRDGQTREFTAATDRVNGEVIRIAVTLRVVK